MRDAKVVRGSGARQLQDSNASLAPGWPPAPRNLYVLIYSAKNLPTLFASEDVFCSLYLDELEKARTMLVCAQGQPSWHEEYHFNCADFENFMVCVNAKSAKQEESCLGMVTLSANTLARGVRTKDSWFPLTSYKRELAQILLEVLKRPTGGTLSLHVTVLEMKPPTKTEIDSSRHNVFVEVLVENSKKKVKRRSKTVLWSSPTFVSSPKIEFSSLDWVDKETLLCVKVFFKRFWGATLLGKATARLSDFPANEKHVSFYDLSNAVDATPLGSLHLRYKYTRNFVLPADQYKTLLELIMRKDLEVAKALAGAAEDRSEVARSLVRIFEAQGVAVDYVTALCVAEMDKVDATTCNTLFRNNSLATMAVGTFMNMFGLEYLNSTLREIVAGIYAGGACQLCGPDAAESLHKIGCYYKGLCTSIFQSAATCPVPIKQLLEKLRREAATRFGEEAGLMVVCSFVVLRYFCPATLSPKLYGLHKEHPSRPVGQVLMSVAKLLQLTSVGALSTLEKTPLEPLQATVDARKAAMRQYLQSISVCEETVASECHNAAPAIDMALELAAIHRQLQGCRAKLLAESPLHPALAQLGDALDALDQQAHEVFGPTYDQPSLG